MIDGLSSIIEGSMSRKTRNKPCKKLNITLHKDLICSETLVAKHVEKHEFFFSKVVYFVLYTQVQDSTELLYNSIF